MASTAINPFRLAIPQAELDDLRRRLQSTRWPPRESVNDWTQGVPLSKAQDLCQYWLDKYDWHRCEAKLNSWPQFSTNIDDVDIHFLHIRSPETDALPMIMTHGWPGSILEFHKVMGPLTDPVKHGGKAADAFHLVLPTIPGYGFSGKPRQALWYFPKIAKAWAELMRRLSYHKYVAQGGDWGADITAQLASDAPDGIIGAHINSVFFDADQEISSEPTPPERKAVTLQKKFIDDESGYFKIQGTRPQTLGYGLADSPSGQAAWVFEKISAWSQHSGDVEEVLSKDEILDNIMLYWLTNSASTSAHLYWHNVDTTALPVNIPIGVSIFPGDQYYAAKSWGERYYKNIVQWNEVEKGGHFAAWEQPEVFVREVRNCFRALRG